MIAMKSTSRIERRVPCLAALLLGALLVLTSTASAQESPATPAADAAPAANAAEPAGEPMIPTKNLLQVLRDGGPLMIPIVGCSMVLLVFVFERLVMLRRSRVIPRPFVKRF